MRSVSRHAAKCVAAAATILGCCLQAHALIRLGIVPSHRLTHPSRPPLPQEEVEFQWGVCKAKLAQLQSEAGSLQDDLAAMRSLAGALKGVLLANKSRVKGFALERGDQRTFDGLEVG